MCCKKVLLIFGLAFNLDIGTLMYNTSSNITLNLPVLLQHFVFCTLSKKSFLGVMKTSLCIPPFEKKSLMVKILGPGTVFNLQYMDSFSPIQMTNYPIFFQQSILSLLCSYICKHVKYASSLFCPTDPLCCFVLFYSLWQ